MLNMEFLLSKLSLECSVFKTLACLHLQSDSWYEIIEVLLGTDIRSPISSKDTFDVT